MAQCVELGLPGRLGLLAAGHQLAGVLEHAGRDLEGLLGVEAEHLLGGGDLLLAERGAVRLAGVLGVRGRPGDDRAQHDEAGPVGDRVGRLDRGVQRRARPRRTRLVVGPVDGLHVPAVGLVAGGDVLGQRDVGVVLDRDPVGVVDHGEVAELAGRRRCAEASARDALLDVAVAADRVDLVVERRVAVVGVRVEQAALPAGGHRHADGVADALAERAGGGLDAGGVAVLRVAGGLAAPGAQRLDVLDLQAPAAEEQLEVERQGGVPARRARTGRGPASAGRRGCAASPSGRAGTPPAPGSSRCRGGRCRPSARRPWRAPGPCPRPCRRARSNPGPVWCSLHSSRRARKLTALPTLLTAAVRLTPAQCPIPPHRTHHEAP